MRTFLLFLAWGGLGAWLILAGSIEPPRSPAHERLLESYAFRLEEDQRAAAEREQKEKEAKETRTRKSFPPVQGTDAETPMPSAAELSSKIAPPPLAGTPATGAALRRETLPAAHEGVTASRSTTFFAYRRTGSAAWPKVHPLLPQAPLILQGGTRFCAYRGNALVLVFWTLEFPESVDAPEAHAGERELLLLARGLRREACVLEGDPRPARCFVFAAPRSADRLRIRSGGKSFFVSASAAPLPPSSSGPIEEIELPRLADATIAGGRFSAHIPEDAPSRIATLGSEALRQSFAQVEVEGGRLPLLVRFDGTSQVAGALSLPGDLAPPRLEIRSGGSNLSLERLLADPAPKSVAALGNETLVHVVSEPER